MALRIRQYRNPSMAVCLSPCAYAFYDGLKGRLIAVRLALVPRRSPLLS